MLHKCITANTSAIWQHAAHTTNQLTSPSCWTEAIQKSLSLKHLSPNPAVFPWCNGAMGGAKLIIAKHVACQVTKHSPDSRKENTLSLLTGLGKGYCCTLLPQIRPDGKVLSSQIAFYAHAIRIANVLVAWRHSWKFRPHFTDSKVI